MEQDGAKLSVKMLGKFSITYGGENVFLGSSRVSRPIQILQILLYRGKEGITRAKLIEELFGRDEFANASNVLNVNVHRLKGILAQSVLPKYEYIRVNKGMFRWDAPVETELDVWRFLALTEEISTGCLKDIDRLREACGMYDTGFLAEYSDMDWIMLEGIHYKKRYEQALGALCSYLIAHKAFEEALEWCDRGCRLYPFDDWQSVRMECLIGMKRYDEAENEYARTAQYFQEEMGIEPSERMRNLMHSLQALKKGNVVHKFIDIVHWLREENAGRGAYYCTMTSFCDNYRLIVRSIGRNGTDAVLMMCTLKPKEEETDACALERAMEHLKEAIWTNLRCTDFFTECSVCQYMLLLYGMREDRCGLIFERICNSFARLQQDGTFSVVYKASQVRCARTDVVAEKGAFEQRRQ